MGLFEVLLVVLVPSLVGVWQARRDVRQQRASLGGLLKTLGVCALLLGATTSAVIAIYALNGGLPLSVRGVIFAGVMGTGGVGVFGFLPSIGSYLLTLHLSKPDKAAKDKPLRRPNDPDNPYQSSAL